MSDQSTSEKTAGLPPELWLKILSSPEHELSYFDLKRLSRVSTEFGKLLEVNLSYKLSSIRAETTAHLNRTAPSTLSSSARPSLLSP